MATEVSLPEVREQSTENLRSKTVPDESGEISLLDLLIDLALGKRLIFYVTVCFAVTAAVVSFLLPKRYTATSTILPPQQNNSMGSVLLSQLGNNLGSAASLASGGLGIKNPNDMFVAMMKSRTVEDAMIKRFGLMQEYHKRYMSDTRKALEKHVSVDDSGKDGLIRISIEDRDPNRAAELTNGYVEQFRNLSEHLAITEAAQRRLFFEEQLEQAKNNLASAEEALKQTEQRTGVLQLDSQTRALIESAAALRAQIVAKQVEISSLSTFATSQNSQLLQAEQELTSLRSQLTKLGGSEESSDANLIVPRGKVPEAGLEYVRKLRDVRYNETIFDILSRQFEMAKLDEAKEGAIIQVIDPAIPPDKKSFPKRTLIVLLSTIAGLFCGIFTVFFRVGFKNLNSTPETRAKLALLRQSIHLRK